MSNQNGVNPLLESVDSRLIRAKELTAKVLGKSVDECFVVWFAKTLQNWKAMTSTTTVGDTSYVEITYDGNNKRTFVDVYTKLSNTIIKDNK